MTLPRPNNFDRRLPEKIDIPRNARTLPLRLLTMSVRLKHMLESAGFTKLGDLQGRQISSFAEYRNFGPKTRRELRKMVLQVQVNARKGDLAQMLDRNVEPITIPAAAKAASFSELPISVRFRNVLEKQNLTRLGDLQGLYPNEFLNVRACGKKTQSELLGLVKRAAAGEFDVPARSAPGLSPAELLAALDRGLAQLPPFSAKAVQLRFGAKADRVVTLAEVGNRMNRTREFIRQVMDEAADIVRRSGGPKLSHALEKLVARCAPPSPPLTAELLGQWVKGNPSRFGHPMFLYPRLLYLLDPRLQIWPNIRWTRDADRLLGKLSDEEVARRVGRSVLAVTNRRRKLAAQ